MAITGIDTIEGKQIIAAGAVSAKSAEMAYNDENGNPITGYQVAGDYYSASNPSGFITGVDLTPYQTTAEMTAYQPVGDYVQGSDLSLNSYNKISAISGHEIAGGGSVDFDYDSDGNISGINSSAISDSRAGTPLYVESPLFTGQSGDSAYIGSDINETIIWTGTGTHYPDKITTNEPLSAFERFKVIGYIPYGNNIRFCIENDYAENSELCLSTNQMGDSILRIFNTSGKILVDGLQLYSAVQNAIWNNTTGDAATVGKWFDTTRSHYIQKVIGINRKRV